MLDHSFWPAVTAQSGCDLGDDNVGCEFFEDLPLGRPLREPTGVEHPRAEEIHGVRQDLGLVLFHLGFGSGLGLGFGGDIRAGHGDRRNKTAARQHGRPGNRPEDDPGDDHKTGNVVCDLGHPLEKGLGVAVLGQFLYQIDEGAHLDVHAEVDLEQVEKRCVETPSALHGEVEVLPGTGAAGHRGLAQDDGGGGNARPAVLPGGHAPGDAQSRFGALVDGALGPVGDGPHALGGVVQGVGIGVKELGQRNPVRSEEAVDGGRGGSGAGREVEGGLLQILEIEQGIAHPEVESLIADHDGALVHLGTRISGCGQRKVAEVTHRATYIELASVFELAPTSMHEWYVLMGHLPNACTTQIVLLVPGRPGVFCTSDSVVTEGAEVLDGADRAGLAVIRRGRMIMEECRRVQMTTTFWRRPSSCALAVASLLLVTAGCGQSSPHSASGSTTTTTAPSTTTSTTPSPWSAPSAAVDGGHPIASVSCPTPSFCLALSPDGTSYRYDGTSWSAPISVIGTGPAPTPAAADLACGSPTFCMAVPGGNEVVRWNGTSWVAAQTLGGAQGLQALACVGNSFCVTVDGEGDAYFYEGNWSSAVNAWGGPNSISCVSPTFCMATAGGTSRWDGRSWTQPQDVDTSGQLDAVSCATASFCVAGDSVGNILAWNGTSWSVPQPVDPGGATQSVGSNALSSVSCVNPTFCIAVDSGGKALSFNGTAWSAPGPIDGGTGLASVSCATTTFCLAVDKQGRVLRYR